MENTPPHINPYQAPDLVTGEAVPKPKYWASIWKLNWFLALIAIPLMGYMGSSTAGGSSNDTAFMVGYSLGALFWSLFLSAIVFFIGRRTKLGANLVFLIIHLLALFGSLSSLLTSKNGDAVPAADRHHNDRVLEEFQKKGEQLKKDFIARAAASEEGWSDELIQEYDQASLDLMKQLISDLRDPLKSMMDQFLQKRLSFEEKSKTYDGATANLLQLFETTLPENLTESDLDSYSLIVENFREENHRLRSLITDWIEFEGYEESLKTEYEREFFSGMNRGIQRKLSPTLEIRDLDEELAAALMELIELHRKDLATLTPSGTIFETSFESPASQKQLEEIIQKTDDISDKQTELQNQFFNQ